MDTARVSPTNDPEWWVFYSYAAKVYLVEDITPVGFMFFVSGGWVFWGAKVSDDLQILLEFR